MRTDSAPGAICHEGVWLPQRETHLTDLMRPGRKRFQRDHLGRATYQRHKLLAAMEFVPDDRRRRAVDIGAHVGLWAMQLENLFEAVVCFEPLSAHADILPFNLRTDRVTINRCALGAKRGAAHILQRPDNTGGSHLSPGKDDGGEPVPVRTLDSFKLTKVDFVKIDVEGYELPVCEGAVETLKRCKPIVVVEQKGNDVRNFDGRRREAVHFLRDLGMIELRPPWSGDHFLGWPA